MTEIKSSFPRSNSKLEDKFWPPAAVAVNVQSLLHANSRYLLDVPPAQGISEEAKVT